MDFCLASGNIENASVCVCGRVCCEQIWRAQLYICFVCRVRVCVCVCCVLCVLCTLSGHKTDKHKHSARLRNKHANKPGTHTQQTYVLLNFSTTALASVALPSATPPPVPFQVKHKYTSHILRYILAVRAHAHRCAGDIFIQTHRRRFCCYPVPFSLRRLWSGNDTDQIKCMQRISNGTLGVHIYSYTHAYSG